MTDSTVNASLKASAGKPLEGLRIADFSAVFAGPYCTRMLGDMGAEIIKIESPAGDSNRGAEPIRDGNSVYFGVLNAGKRSVVLDLKNDRDLAVAREIATNADVVIENFRPGVMARLGLGYDVIAAENPGVVYCSISGYGQEGPKSKRPATAQIIQAGSGFDSAFMGYQPTDVPPATGLFVADALAGALALGAILAALRGSDVTGQGSHIDLSLEDSMISMLTFEVASAQVPPGFRRQGYKAVKTSDGFVMFAPVNDRTFEALVRTAGAAHLLEDPRFATTALRWRNYNDLHAEVEAWSLTRSTDECMMALSDAGVPASDYATVAERMRDEHLVQRGSFIQATDASGDYLVPNLPFQFSSLDGAEPVPREPTVVPTLGAHTREVLREISEGRYLGSNRDSSAGCGSQRPYAAASVPAWYAAEGVTP